MLILANSGGSVSQSISGCDPTRNYTITISAAQRYGTPVATAICNGQRVYAVSNNTTAPLVREMADKPDGDAPHAPGGAIASPLSVAELPRCHAEDVLGRRPGQMPAVVPVNTAGAFTKVQNL